MTTRTGSPTAHGEDAVTRRHRRVRRLTLMYATGQGLLGAWAYIAPHGFWTDFPFPGSGWLTTLGGFDGHITRDLGLAWMGLALIAGWAARRGPIEGVRLVLASLVLTGSLHLAYHLTTFDLFSPSSAISQLFGLVALVALPALLWWQCTVTPRSMK